MGTLTGQQINNTYDGLLKLSDSTTGITSSLQAIEDGLGNNTGTRIATNLFTAPNIPNLNFNLKPDYAGTGVASGAGIAMPANSQNTTLYTLFYDAGVYDYSAITYNLGTLTSTSDVVTTAFYTLQLVNEYGIGPADLIMSGITLDSTGSTGIKTTLLPSTLSFSGYGGGFFVCCSRFTNSGVTPTVRYGGMITTSINQSVTAYSLGYYINASGNALTLASRQPWLASQYFPLALPFQTSYSPLDIRNNITNPFGTAMGFGLKLRK